MTKYERNVLRLCEDNDIIIFRKRNDFAADIAHKAIWINKDIRSVRTYSTALHEIAHIINENPIWPQVQGKWHWYNKRNQEFVTEHVLNSEFDAWVTAKRIAKWWNLSADKNAIDSLFSYIEGYNQVHKHPWSGIPNKDIKWYLPVILQDRGLIELCAKEMYE